MMKIESDTKVLSVEETKQAKDDYLDVLKSRCRLQILFGEDPFQTYVVVDDQVIGCVQKILVDVDSENQLNRTVEIAFPKIGSKSDIKKQIKKHAENLASLGFVNVVYKNLHITKMKSSPPHVESKVEVEEEKEEIFVESSDEDFERSLALVRI